MKTVFFYYLLIINMVFPQMLCKNAIKQIHPFSTNEEGSGFSDSINKLPIEEISVQPFTATMQGSKIVFYGINEKGDAVLQDTKGIFFAKQGEKCTICIDSESLMVEPTEITEKFITFNKSGFSQESYVLPAQGLSYASNSCFLKCFYNPSEKSIPEPVFYLFGNFVKLPMAQTATVCDYNSGNTITMVPLEAVKEQDKLYVKVLLKHSQGCISETVLSEAHLMDELKNHSISFKEKHRLQFLKIKQHNEAIVRVDNKKSSIKQNEILFFNKEKNIFQRYIPTSSLDFVTFLSSLDTHAILLKSVTHTRAQFIIVSPFLSNFEKHNLSK